MVWLFGLVYGFIIQKQLHGFQQKLVREWGKVQKMKPIQFLAGPNIISADNQVHHSQWHPHTQNSWNIKSSTSVSICFCDSELLTSLRSGLVGCHHVLTEWTRWFGSSPASGRTQSSTHRLFWPRWTYTNAKEQWFFFFFFKLSLFCFTLISQYQDPDRRSS